MNQFERSCRKFVKRHGEALFIAAFLLADCFLSGWALTVGTVAAILYVLVPAIRTLPTLDAKGQLTFLKAFVKTAKFQKLAILLFWIYSIRALISVAIDSALLTVGTSAQTPSLTNALFLGAREFAPIAFLTKPVFIFAGTCVAAIIWRSRLKATKDDPDLIKQRQVWSRVVQVGFLFSYIGSILMINLNVRGPAIMMSNWLLASARDANLYNTEDSTIQFADPPGGLMEWPITAPSLVQADVGNKFSDFAFVSSFDTFMITALSIVAFLILLQPMLRLTSFFTSFCWRVVSPGSLQNIVEGFLEALRLKERVLGFNERNIFWANALRTLAWLVTCYAGLFWVFGICGGPLGNAIQNWMIASGVDAGFVGFDGASKFLFDDSYRVFLGSIVALYGTAPLAVTLSVLLPYAKARKITLNCDGISFFQGPYLSLWGRQTRLWSDLKSLKIVKSQTIKPKQKPTFALVFSLRWSGQIRQLANSGARHARIVGRN